MTKGFPRMNSKQKEYCPTGYVWLTNISYYADRSVPGITLDEFISGLVVQDRTVHLQYTEAIKKFREQYGDVIVTDAFDILGRPSVHTDVAVYVLHPAIKRINKTLKILKARRDIK